jgi:hypothetical protein
MIAGCDAKHTGAFLVSVFQEGGTKDRIPSGSNELQGTPVCLAKRLDRPVSSGAIPQWHPANRRPRAQMVHRELKPSLAGSSDTGGHRRSISLCKSFPTSKGDKITDAEQPPQLPLLRDSKSFVKGISRLAKWGEKCLQAAPRRGHNWLSTSGPVSQASCPQAIAGLAQRPHKRAAAARQPRWLLGTSLRTPTTWGDNVRFNVASPRARTYSG